MHLTLCHDPQPFVKKSAEKGPGGKLPLKDREVPLKGKGGYNYSMVVGKEVLIL